jgi:hypothetical protein
MNSLVLDDDLCVGTIPSSINNSLPIDLIKLRVLGYFEKDQWIFFDFIEAKKGKIELVVQVVDNFSPVTVALKKENELGIFDFFITDSSEIFATSFLGKITYLNRKVLFKKKILSEVSKEMHAFIRPDYSLKEIVRPKKMVLTRIDGKYIIK